MSIRDVRRIRRQRLAEGRLAEPEPAAEIETLYEFVDRDLEDRSSDGSLAPDTIQGYWAAYRYWIHDDLGDCALDVITRDDVLSWRAELFGRGVSPGGVRRAARTLSALLGAAVDRGVISSNPAANLPRLPADTRPPASQRALSEEQLERLLDHPRQTLRISTMLRTSAEGGLRRAELCGLRWPDVDLKGRTIWVRRGYGGRPTKGKRARRIGISERLADGLATWSRESVKVGARDRTGPVWPGKDGGEMERHTPTQAHMRAMRRAGLCDDEGRPLVPLHGLRHTCASLMLARGVPLIVVSRHLGHSSTQITSQVYAHLTPDEQMKATSTVFDEINGQKSGKALRGTLRVA